MDGDANVTLELIHWATATPDAPSLRTPGRTLTYQELNTLTWRSARLLHEQGVRAGDVAALAFTSEPALAIAILAVARLGAAGFSLPGGSGALERRVLARQAGAGWLVSDDPTLFDSDIPSATLDVRRAAREPGRVDPAILAEHPRAPWQIIRGSGSTGAPKLIPVTHAQARSRFAAAVQGASVTVDDCVTTVTSLDFAMAKHRYGWALATGASYAILSGYAGDQVSLLGSMGVTLLGGTAFHAERLLEAADSQIAALVRMRAFSVAGSVVGDELRSRLRTRLGDRLWVAYSSNEGGHLTLATPPEVFDTSGTVGRRLPTVDLEIVDGQDRAVPVGTNGEVRVRGPGVADGYWNEAEAAPTNFRDGWFYPGDLGRFTADGQLIHLGRADQMMICDGINIHPAEIESALMAHPAVRDAAAVPLPHPTHQNVAICAVVLREGGKVSEQELLGHARERLGQHGPAAIVIVVKIPRNEAGKLQRTELVDLLRRRVPLD